MMEQDHFGERLLSLLGAARISQSDVARSLGVSRQSVNGWVKGRSLPSSAQLPRLSEILGMSVNELMGSQAEPGTPGTSIRAVPTPGGTEEAGIASISASRAWVETYAPGSAAKGLGCMAAMGDAMSPCILSGDTLILETAKKGIDRDGVFAFTNGKDVFVRRLQILFDGSLRANADNPAYAAFTISPEERERLDVLGRVVAALSPRRVQ